MRKMLTVVGVAAGVAAGVPGAVLAAPVPQDCAATVSAGDVHRYEGTGTGTTAFEFTVAVSASCAVTGSVQFLTEYGTATATDFTAVAGSLTWTASSSAQTVTVPVSPDPAEEPEEEFTLRLANPVGLALGAATATGHVLDDDTSPPGFGTNGKICWRPGPPTCDVAISVQPPLAAPVTLTYRTIGAAQGYVPVPGAVLTIPAGATSAVAPVRLLAGTWPDEVFTLEIAGPSSGRVVVPKAAVTIRS
jgi:hypothetical protein